MGVPQLGQPVASADPQLKQNRAPVGLAVPQEAQVIGARAGSRPRVQSTGPVLPGPPDIMPTGPGRAATGHGQPDPRMEATTDRTFL